MGRPNFGKPPILNPKLQQVPRTDVSQSVSRLKTAEIGQAILLNPPLCVEKVF